MAIKNKFSETNRYIRFLHRCIIGLIILLGLFSFAFVRIPKFITVYTPPDTSKAFMHKVAEIPSHAVYSFARTFWESLNYCEKDCADEYPQRLSSYSHYLTRRCLTDLQRHFDNNRGLYSYRNRVLLPTENALFNESSVKALSADNWLVKLEYNLKDEVSGSLTRYNRILYPLMVVRSNRPLDLNPLGLEVDCYYGNGPTILEQYDISEKAR